MRHTLHFPSGAPILMSETTSPSLPATLRALRDVVTVGALSGLLVATSLAAQTSESTEGELIIANQSSKPSVRELAIPTGAADLPATARRVSAKIEDHGKDEGEVAVAAGPALAALNLRSTKDFSMLGVTWDDPRVGAGVTVEARTKDDEGWSGWEQLHIEAAPAPESQQVARGGTEPLWVGDSHGVQVRVGGERPRGLELSLIDPGDGPDLALQGARVGQPNIITRRQWGANPSMTEPCSNGLYGLTAEAVTIHHTVNSNNYTKAEADNLVRGIYAYHTQSNGWCDVGYNFLVDKYGQIFQGRRGWMQRQVQGAHAGDAAVNEQSTGISLIGNFENARPTRAMKAAVVRLTSWRLDRFYRNPKGIADIRGSKYPRVMGHRDVKSTACPGRYAYAWLDNLRAAAAARVNDGRTPIERYWRNNGGQGGWLGWPRVGERPLGEGNVTTFRDGNVYQHRATGVHEVHGAIRTHYARKGGPLRFLGFPVTDEQNARVNGSKVQRFWNGRIYFTPRIGAHEVHGLIVRKYVRSGAEAGPLGLPTSDETRGVLVRTRFNTFQRGAIYSHPKVGRHIVRGAILYKYRGLNADGGPLRLPTSDEYTNGGANITNFQRGAIYHSPGTGAQAVRGAIYHKYRDVGAEDSRLGLPTSDEFAVERGRRSNFQRGYIVFDTSTYRATVHYTG